jgi:crotonobetainyl-CoA:carnitine CoA-transferase CaiB-like acyl-CoA transferase
MRSAAELASLMEKAGLPFAPIRRPEDLYDDEHLLATGGLADVRCPTVRAPARPSRPRCCPSPWPASGWACGSIRRSWASTAANCCAAVTGPTAIARDQGRRP